MTYRLSRWRRVAHKNSIVVNGNQGDEIYFCLVWRRAATELNRVAVAGAVNLAVGRDGLFPRDRRNAALREAPTKIEIRSIEAFKRAPAGHADTRR